MILTTVYVCPNSCKQQCSKYSKVYCSRKHDSAKLNPVCSILRHVLCDYSEISITSSALSRIIKVLKCFIVCGQLPWMSKTNLYCIIIGACIGTRNGPLCKGGFLKTLLIFIYAGGCLHDDKCRLRSLFMHLFIHHSNPEVIVVVFCSEYNLPQKNPLWG